MLHRFDDIPRQRQVGTLLSPHLLEALHGLFRSFQDQMLGKICPISRMRELIEREVLERGSPTVQIGTWLEALWVLDELGRLSHLLEERESLLDLARREESARPRRRASRRGR